MRILDVEYSLRNMVVMMSWFAHCVIQQNAQQILHAFDRREGPKYIRTRISTSATKPIEIKQICVCEREREIERRRR